jgi:hypothetical protein
MCMAVVAEVKGRTTWRSRLIGEPNVLKLVILSYLCEVKHWRFFYPLKSEFFSYSTLFPGN